MSRTNKTFDTAPHAFTGTGRSRIIPRSSRPGGGAPRGASCGRVPARALRLVNFYALSANLERHLTSRRRSCDPELGGWVDLKRSACKVESAATSTTCGFHIQQRCARAQVAGTKITS